MSDTERIQAELDSAREEIAFMYRRLRDGTLHELHCNVQNEPVGYPGCSCTLGRRIRNLEVQPAIPKDDVIMYGPNTVSIQGDQGPFGSDAGRVHIWFRDWYQATRFANWLRAHLDCQIHG